MTMPSSGWEIVIVGAGAFFGVMARAARWVTPDGKFDWRKAAFELLTAPSCGMIAAAIGTHFGVDYIIMGGIAAILGLLGPVAIEAAVTRIIDRKAA